MCRRPAILPNSIVAATNGGVGGGGGQNQQHHQQPNLMLLTSIDAASTRALPLVLVGIIMSIHDTLDKMIRYVKAVSEDNNLAMIEAHMTMKNNDSNTTTLATATATATDTDTDTDTSASNGDDDIIGKLVSNDMKRILKYGTIGRICACHVNIRRTKWMIQELIRISDEFVTVAYRLKTIDAALDEEEQQQDNHDNEWRRDFSSATVVVPSANFMLLYRELTDIKQLIRKRKDRVAQLLDISIDLLPDVGIWDD